MTPHPRTINVLVCTSLTDTLFDKLARFDPRVRVTDAAALLLPELPTALRPGQSWPPLRAPGQSLDQLLAGAEVILSARRLPKDVARRSPRLRWVQSPLAGVDWLKDTDLWGREDILLTSASGINARPVAEYTFMAIMALSKDVRRIFRSQEQRTWDRFEPAQLHGKTIGIVGYGAIGREVARIAQAFGMRVIAVKRRVTSGEGLPDWVWPVDRLPRLLAEADYVVLSVPGATQTRGMIGPREIATMKSSAVLVNVSRGDVVDEEALTDALRRELLAGAALDVFRTEPLPKDSPLWTMPNVLVSGHLAGLFANYDSSLLDLFTENLRLYLEGRPLRNVVDRAAGY